MREILFRAKCLASGDFVYGDLIQYEPIPCIRPINQDFGEKYDYDEIEVDNETIGQFTGLLDKKGNKIFEGDIVKVLNKPYESKEPIIVVWGKKSYGWSLKFNCGNHYEHKPLIKYYSLPSSKNIEIIGNIHDHATL